jgi:NAD(P)-dependent dehydrogenase (short-subunit alcohol dehydrogenase family)
VLVVGASRGIGLAVVEEYARRGSRVVGTVRGTGRTALHDLADRSAGAVDVEHVDTTVDDEIGALAQRLAGRRFDLLLVNAGVTHDQSLTSATISPEEFSRVMVTNALAPLRVAEALRPLVADDGTIALTSSGQGSVAGNTGGGWELYRASKAALNQLTRSWAARHADDGRALLLLAPGWVRTDLGGEGAASSTEEAVPPLVDTVDAQHGRPGLQFLDREGRTVAW